MPKQSLSYIIGFSRIETVICIAGLMLSLQELEA